MLQERIDNLVVVMTNEELMLEPNWPIIQAHKAARINEMRKLIGLLEK
jgi:hypothetical protein